MVGINTVFIFMALAIVSAATIHATASPVDSGGMVLGNLVSKQLRDLSVPTVRQSQNDTCRQITCFVLQGGDRVNDTEYLVQLAQVFLLSQPSIFPDFSVSVVQYGNGTTIVSRPTSNSSTVLEILENPSRVSGSSRNGFARGMRFCERQLRSLGDVRKSMVVFGDFFTSITKREQREARKFRSSGGEVFAVPVGDWNPDALQRLTGKAEPLVSAANYVSLPRISRLADRIATC